MIPDNILKRCGQCTVGIGAIKGQRHGWNQGRWTISLVIERPKKVNYAFLYKIKRSLFFVIGHFHVKPIFTVKKIFNLEFFMHLY